MNAKTLQRQYDKLTARERLALLLAADARGDEREHRALLDAAPTALYRLPHHWQLFDTLQLLALSYLVNQLDRAWAIGTLAHISDDVSPTSDRAWRAARIAAYVFCVQADAWRAFCGELEIDPNALIVEFADALFSLEFAERIAREFAFTFDEAQGEVVKEFGNDADVITSERALNDLRALLKRGAG